MPSDTDPVESGCQGTVEAFDDAGHILIDWDDHRGLNLLPGVDRFHIISTPSELEQSFRWLRDQQDKVERDENSICPRCGQSFDLHRGAVSRRFPNTQYPSIDQIRVCDGCGVQESIEDFVIHGAEYGVGVEVEVPAGVNHTGFETEPEEGDKERLKVQVKPLSDWFIVKRWIGRDSERSQEVSS